jgi:site-specific DNA-methyltransferase (adenine-specific)
MEILVRLFSDRGELVLDPFAGSGTTGVAALRHGRRFVGWEMNPTYAAITRKRLGAAREQLEIGFGRPAETTR